MNIKREKDKAPEEGKRMILSEYTASGACQFRRDMKSLKMVKRLQEQNIIVLNKRITAILFPWTINKLKRVLGEDYLHSINEGHKKIMGLKISLELFNELFSQSSIFERLANKKYKKANQTHVARRQNNLIKKRKTEKSS